ncbi:unnamed protein product [Urochloa humidicola]
MQMASARSGSSSRWSASSVRAARDDGTSWSPVAYREEPLEYRPPEDVDGSWAFTLALAVPDVTLMETLAYMEDDSP